VHDHRCTVKVHPQRIRKSHMYLLLANGYVRKVATTFASPQFFSAIQTKEIGRGTALSGRGL